jgi:peptidoglycan/xylan/chitin deacetylase (PgdA/CDA1 family)
MRYVLLTFICLMSVPSLGQPTVSFTFDDGSTSDRPGYAFQVWNDMLLGHLDNADLEAVFFVKGAEVANEKGQYLLDSWNNRGHNIANHTYTHPNFNSEEVSAEDFELELLKTDTLINDYTNYTKLFRFPYLKEGNTTAKVDSIRNILSGQGYRHGHVTIDASDWYIDSRLISRLRENPKADLEPFKKFYLEHILERAVFYEELSYALNQRHINHTLLLHHNLTAALFLDDLIAFFKANGWQVISADKAFEDPVFNTITQHAGESLIWAMAKDSGKFEHLLRYPAEDSRYEKVKMDNLGL